MTTLIEGTNTIVRLEATNIKRLKAVSITPDGNLVMIRGQNANGKTSLLDSIQMALGGKSSIPGRPIRDGETTASIIVETQDYTVERTWTSNENSYLEVRSSSGAKLPSPQKTLDQLVGALSFDPLAFMREKPAQQAEVVRKLVGLDFTALEAKRKTIFDERTMVNRDVSALSHRLGPSLPKCEPVDVAAALAELETLRKQESGNAYRKREVDDASSAVNRATADLSRSHLAVLAAESALQAAKNHEEFCGRELENVSGELAVAKDSLGQVVDLGPSIAAVKARLADAEAINQKARAYAQRLELETELKAKEQESLDHSAKLAKIDNEKEAQLKAAKFPIADLSIGEAGLTYKALPLEQASGAEQLMVSVSMGIALNPKLRVLLVRDGSLLDKNSLAVLARLAEQNGCQVWLEMVSEEGTGIIIEDGSVKQVNP